MSRKILYLVAVAAAALAIGSASGATLEDRFKVALTHYANLEDEQAVQILEALQGESFALATTMLGIMHNDPLFAGHDERRAVDILRANMMRERKYAPFQVGFQSFVFEAIEENRLNPREYVDLFHAAYTEGHPNAAIFLLIGCNIYPAQCEEVGALDELRFFADKHSYLPDEAYGQFAEVYLSYPDEPPSDTVTRVTAPYLVGAEMLYPAGFAGAGLMELLVGLRQNSPEQMIEGLVDILVGQMLSNSPIYELSTYLERQAGPLIQKFLSELSDAERRELEVRANRRLARFAFNKQKVINSHAAWCFANVEIADAINKKLVPCLKRAFDDGARCETPAIVSDLIGRESRIRYDACRKQLLAN